MNGISSYARLAAFVVLGSAGFASCALAGETPAKVPHLPPFIFHQPRPTDAAWDRVQQDPNQTNIYDYLVFCAGGGYSECNDNVQIAVDYLIQGYAHARTGHRTRHRLYAASAGFTGAGLAVGAAALPPVGLTILAVAATAPIMYDDMAGVNNRTALYAAGAVSLQALSFRYQGLKASARHALAAYDELQKAYLDSTTAVDFRKHCLRTDKPDYSALPADFTATKVIATDIASLNSKCNAVIARKVDADLLYGDLRIALNLDSTNGEGGEDAIDQAYANDTLRLLDEMEAVQRSFDVAPGAALATAVAAPIQAVATLLKGGANSLTGAGQITVINDVVPTSQISVTTIQTTPFSTTVALSDVDASSFKDLTGWSAPAVKALANTAAAKAAAAKATRVKSDAAHEATADLQLRSNAVVSDLNNVGQRFNVLQTRFQEFQTLNNGAGVTLVMGPPTFGTAASPKQPAPSGTNGSAQGSNSKTSAGSSGAAPS